MSNAQNEIPKIIGNYKITETLGSGSFGKVKLGIHLPTSEQVAIKILSKSSIQSSSYKSRIMKEINYLQTIKHPNIVKVFEIIETDSWYFLIFEYIKGGELFNLISKKTRLNSNETCLFLYQIINAVEYLHLNKISHRDLKPENILLSSNSSLLKLIDFGLAAETLTNSELSTQCGSPNYSSPEMLRGMKYNGHLVDIWSIGIIAFLMICGYLPFEDSNEQILIKKISKGRYDFPHFTPFIFRDFIKKTLIVNPKSRMSLSLMKEHTVYKHGKALFFRENVIYKYNNTLDPIINEENKRRTINYIQTHNLINDININNITEWEEEPIYKIIYEKILSSSNWKKFLLEINDKDDISYSLEKRENEPCSPQDIIRRLRMLNANERYKSSITKSNGRNNRSASASNQKIIISELNSEMNSLNQTLINEVSYDKDKLRCLKTPYPVHRTINLNIVNHNYSTNPSYTSLTPRGKNSYCLRSNKHKLSNKNLIRNNLSPVNVRVINHKHHQTEYAPPMKNNNRLTSKKAPLANIYMTTIPTYTKVDLSPSIKTISMNKLKTSTNCAFSSSTSSVSFRDKCHNPSIINTSKQNNYDVTGTPKAKILNQLSQLKQLLNSNSKNSQISGKTFEVRKKDIVPSLKAKNNRIALNLQLEEDVSPGTKKNKPIHRKGISIKSNRGKNSQINHCLTPSSKASLLNNYFALLNKRDKEKAVHRDND